jgi:hypothetical protein
MSSVKAYDEELLAIRDEIRYLKKVAIPNLKTIKSATHEKLKKLEQLLEKEAIPQMK